MQRTILLTLVFIALDYAWLQIFMYDKYLSLFTPLFKRTLTAQYISTISFYALVIVGLRYFAIKHKNRFHSAFNGGLFGLIVYGSYNAVLYTFMPATNYLVFMIDTLWGVALSASACYFTSVMMHLDHSVKSKLNKITNIIFKPFHIIHKHLSKLFKATISVVKHAAHSLGSLVHELKPHKKHKTKVVQVAKVVQKTTSAKSKSHSKHHAHAAHTGHPAHHTNHKHNTQQAQPKHH